MLQSSCIYNICWIEDIYWINWSDLEFSWICK